MEVRGQARIVWKKQLLDFHIGKNLSKEELLKKRKETEKTKSSIVLTFFVCKKGIYKWHSK